jgi:hypothetical protein
MRTSGSCTGPFLPLLLTAALLLIAACSAPPPVDLAADVDRDGVVDLRKDAAGEEAWTARRGALFLNNNDPGPQPLIVGTMVQSLTVKPSTSGGLPGWSLIGF